MASEFEIGFGGDMAALERFLDDIPDVLERRIVKSGLVAMGSHFVTEMRLKIKLNNSNRSGGLARNIKNRSGGIRYQYVKIYAPHWHLLEYGTDHRFHKSGHYTGLVTQKAAFVRPTLYEQTDAARAKFEYKVRLGLEKYAGVYL